MIYNIFLTQSPESLTIYGEGGRGKKRQGVLQPFSSYRIRCECFSIVVSAAKVK